MGSGKSKKQDGNESEPPLDQLRITKKSSAFSGKSFDDKVEEMVNQIKRGKGETTRKDVYVSGIGGCYQAHTFS